MKVWILTEEYNAYDQFGVYFIEVFAEKPTVEKLMLATGCSDVYCEWLLNTNGGCVNPWNNYLDSWYTLQQVTCK